MRSSTRSAQGFTLVELLVVVSIIGLLVSLLLPSLSKAREQAKQVKCQTNMRSINTALLTYAAEFDAFPIVVLTTDEGCPRGYCSWSYGGWLGKNPFWRTALGGYRQIPANRRPLTVYMNKNEVAAPVQTGPGAKDLEEVTGQPVFRCPSDTVSTQWRWWVASADDTYSAYDDVGTSYQMNSFGWYQTRLVEGVDYDGDGTAEQTLGVCGVEPVESCTSGPPTVWPCRSRQMQRIWAMALQRFPSRYVTIDEDPFDYAVFRGIQEMGFHRQFSQHNLAFLDGHVANVAADTRRMSGSEWTVLAEDMEWSIP
ncbi:MAG: DUF1559 domain-containing protein [bacterium]|nr:DUF1559 domain-containing protein [bacterium]